MTDDPRDTTGDVHERLDRLESLVAQQQETIQAIQNRLDRQQATLKQQREYLTSLGASDESGELHNDVEKTSEESSRFSRRSLLQAAAAIGVGSYATGVASAAEPRGVLGSNQHPVRTLYLNTLRGPVTDGTAVSTLAGGGLTINEGTLEAAATSSGNEQAVFTGVTNGTLQFRSLAAGDNVEIDQSDDVLTITSETIGDSHTSVSDDGTFVVSSTDDIDFGTNLDVTADGDGTATVDADVQGATNWQEVDSDDLLETVSPYTGIDVADVQTDSLAGDVTGGTDLTNLLGNGLTLSGGALGITSGGVGSGEIASGSVGSTELASDSVTVAGNSVSLGGSTAIDYVDLADTGSSFPIPNADIANSSLTVAGNSVSLGGSTGVAHSDLSGIDSSDHHTRPSAGDGLTESSNTFDIEPTDFAGNALKDDGSNNLAVSSGGIGTNELNTNFTDLATLFGSPVDAGGNIDMGGSNITNVGGGVNPDSGAIRLGNNEKIAWTDSTYTAQEGEIFLSNSNHFAISPPTSLDGLRQPAPDTDEVSLSAIDENEILFALAQGTNEAKLLAKGTDNKGTITVGTYSTERLKTDIESYAGNPASVLDVEAQTFTLGSGDGDRRLGVTAESAHEAGLEWLVEYTPVENAWQHNDGIDDEYVEEYGIERDGETLVPDDVHDRAWLAMHHELLRELVEERDERRDREERIDDLEAENERLDEETDALREENERLRRRNEQLEARIEAIEARLDADGTNGRQGVADD